MSLIVVGVDGSEQSQRALTWALGYAAEKSSTVQAITVVDTRRLDEAQRAARVAEAERELERLVGEAIAAVPHPAPVTYEVVEGDPVVVLVDATESADLIVFGSHRMSSLRHPEMSTVSLACIRMGACPVLVIPADLPERGRHSALVPA